MVDRCEGPGQPGLLYFVKLARRAVSSPQRELGLEPTIPVLSRIARGRLAASSDQQPRSAACVSCLFVGSVRYRLREPAGHWLANCGSGNPDLSSASGPVRNPKSLVRNPVAHPLTRRVLTCFRTRPLWWAVLTCPCTNKKRSAVNQPASSPTQASVTPPQHGLLSSRCVCR